MKKRIMTLFAFLALTAMPFSQAFAGALACYDKYDGHFCGFPPCSNTCEPGGPGGNSFPDQGRFDCKDKNESLSVTLLVGTPEHGNLAYLVDGFETAQFSANDNRNWIPCRNNPKNEMVCTGIWAIHRTPVEASFTLTTHGRLWVSFQRFWGGSRVILSCHPVD